MVFVESVGMGSWGLGMGSLLSIGKSVPDSPEGALLMSDLFSSLVLPSTGLSLAVASASGMELDSCVTGMESSVFEFCAVFKSSLVEVVSACGMESDSGTGIESSVAELCSVFGSLPPLVVMTIAGTDSSLSTLLLVDSFVADLDFSCDFERLLLKGGGAV